MTPEQFEHRARSCRTRQELEQLEANALSKSRKDFAQIAHSLLDVMFPIRTRKGGGATPSTVSFKGKVQRFFTGKDGYVWLVDQFGQYRSNLFAEYEEFHRKRKSSGCRLAKSPKDLFPNGSKRAETASNYASVSGDWYVDANLNHVGKFELLLQLGYLSKLDYPTDWDFEIEGSTDDLLDRKRAVLRAEQILKNLLAM